MTSVAQQEVEQPVQPPKTSLTTAQQCFNFWMLSTVIRRGFINPKTNRRNKLTGEEMIARINHYLLHFNWNDKMLERIAVLQDIAYKTLRGQNVVTETDSGNVRSTPS